MLLSPSKKSLISGFPAVIFQAIASECYSQAGHSKIWCLGCRGEGIPSQQVSEVSASRGLVDGREEEGC